MSRTLKAMVYKIGKDYTVFQNACEDKNFSNVLYDFYQYKHSKGNNYFISNSKGKEISIWIDSLIYKENFNDAVFNNTICFLLAKDFTCYAEDKTKSDLDILNNRDSKISPKSLTHCVFFIEDNILLMEHYQEGVNAKLFLKGLNSMLNSTGFAFTMSNIARKDVLDRLYAHIDTINKVEFKGLELDSYLKANGSFDERDIDGEILSLLYSKNKDVKVVIQMIDATKENKNNAFNILKKSIDSILNISQQKSRDIKITYVDDSQKKQTIEMLNNFQYLSLEVDNSIEDIYNIDGATRIDISRNIYFKIIEEYRRYKENEK